MASNPQSVEPVESIPLVLALDTSSKFSSISVLRGAEMTAGFGAALDGKRSERIWDEIEFLLGEVGASITDVDIFCVCTGPGGFTGLRVGIAAVKGFAASSGKPAIGVSSLEAIAYACGPSPASLVLTNAYRGEVYSQLFSFDSDHLPIAAGLPAVGPAGKILNEIKYINSILLCGNAATSHIDLIKEAAGDRFCHQIGNDTTNGCWVIRDSPSFLAEYIGRLGYIKFRSTGSKVSGSLAPCYVREADAQTKLALGLVGTGFKLRSDAAGSAKTDVKIPEIKRENKT